MDFSFFTWIANAFVAIPFKIPLALFLLVGIAVYIALLFGNSEEGLIVAYYGRRGRGKTYAMTADIIAELNRGVVVYCNYEIEWNGYNEKNFWFYRIQKFCGIKKEFKEYPKSNLRRFSSIEQFPKIKNALVALDEGYLYFDSYQMTKVKMSIRKAVLMSRHNDVTLWYSTQRVMSIHVVLRSMTDIFYRLNRVRFPFLGVMFMRDTFDLGSDEVVDENKSYGKKLYKLDMNIARRYNTKGTVFFDE